MGFEPTTVCLGSRYATTASHPQRQIHYSQDLVESQMPLSTLLSPLRDTAADLAPAKVPNQSTRPVLVCELGSDLNNRYAVIM